MLYKILGEYSLFGAFLGAFFISFLNIKYFKRILPKDQGRAFAVNGALSEGKPRGAGIIFITAFMVSAALFMPLNAEYIFYMIFIYAAMLSGYFDDAAEKPWGNLKKGLIDMVIAVGSAFTYYHFNGSDINLMIFGVKNVHLNPILFVILGAVLVWTSINVTNCSDGVDGLCASLVMATLMPVILMYSNKVIGAGHHDNIFVVIMLATLIGYLWFNVSPSQLLMGDAGSRALGVFLAVIFMKIGDPLLFIPMALMLIIDGGLGLLKLSFRRFLKMKKFMDSIRTPIHDHMRKNKKWSDTQVVMRFTMIQLIINICCIALINHTI